MTEGPQQAIELIKALQRSRWEQRRLASALSDVLPELLPRILEPFFSTRPPGHGTGLGLAQVHGLISQHGGHIDVSSTVGEGTTVSFWIPAL